VIALVLLLTALGFITMGLRGHQVPLPGPVAVQDTPPAATPPAGGGVGAASSGVSSPVMGTAGIAATSSFFEWAIAAEHYTAGENPMQRKVDEALRRVPDRHQPFVGSASRQQPVRRTVRVRCRCGCRGR